MIWKSEISKNGQMAYVDKPQVIYNLYLMITELEAFCCSYFWFPEGQNCKMTQSPDSSSLLPAFQLSLAFSTDPLTEFIR